MSGSDTSAVWVVKDPLGRPVVLTKDQKQHIIDGHPEFGEYRYITALPDVISQPHMILLDIHDFDTEIFCKRDVGAGDFSGKWLKVPVRYDISDSGKIITAYFSPQVPKGEIKWLPPKIEK